MSLLQVLLYLMDSELLLLFLSNRKGYGVIKKCLTGSVFASVSTCLCPCRCLKSINKLLLNAKVGNRVRIRSDRDAALCVVNISRAAFSRPLRKERERNA